MPMGTLFKDQRPLDLSGAKQWLATDFTTMAYITDIFITFFSFLASLSKSYLIWCERFLLTTHTDHPFFSRLDYQTSLIFDLDFWSWSHFLKQPFFMRHPSVRALKPVIKCANSQVRRRGLTGSGNDYLAKTQISASVFFLDGPSSSGYFGTG